MKSSFKLILILAGACVATQAALLGTKQCTYGPSFWCASIKQANQCNAVSHCIERQWSKGALAADDDAVCDICKIMVEQARIVLSKNETEAELLQVLDASCHAIPFHEISHECVELVADYLPELIEILKSDLNPQIVCAAAGLCNSARIDRLISENPQAIEVASAPITWRDPEHNDCQDCKHFLQDLIDLVNSKSEQELEDHLMSICNELGSISGPCKTLVAMNIHDIYYFIANQLDVDSTCDIFGMCGSVRHRYPSTESGSETCDFCKIVAYNIRQQLVDNTTRTEYKELLESVCRQTGGFEQECTQLVDLIGDSFYDWLVHNFDATLICRKFGLCNAIMMNRASPHELGQTLPVKMGWAGDDEANANGVAQLPTVDLSSIHVISAGANGLNTESDETCIMCEFTLHFIQQQLDDKKTRADIEKAVKGVCQFLPHSLDEQCQDYIDAYGDQVIEILEQEIDPSTVCPALGLCPASINEAIEIAKLDPNGKLSCVGCEFLNELFKSMLSDKAMDGNRRLAYSSASIVTCRFRPVPRSLYPACRNFLNNDASRVMAFLDQGVPPQDICRKLEYCPQSTAIHHLPLLGSANQLPISRLFGAPSQSVVQGQSKMCVLCEFALNLIEKMIVDKNTEEGIKEAVEGVCLVLPSTLSNDCVNFVELYTEAIVELLVHEVNPQMVCRELTICDHVKIEALLHASAVQMMPNQGIQKRSTSTNLLGAGECSWGPAQWCLNERTRNLCGVTLEYCQKLNEE